jgi:DNA topoisomerase-1
MKTAVAYSGGSAAAATARNGSAPADALISAKAASLRYVSDTSPGIRRRRSGSGFVYLDPGGKVVRDPDEIRRIRGLAIPPAWRDVWICPVPNGHLQATGRDAKGRKQYRYHPRWREVRDEDKYGRLIEFANVLPRIRKTVDRHLALPGLPREKVLAAVVRLLETTFIRVGNEEYARENGSFGLATMRDRHVNVSGATVQFQFRGKSGIQHAVDLNDRRIATIVKRCQDLPGYELFQYIGDGGEPYSISSVDVNDYLREIAGAEFTTKDFRTWAGTVLAARALQQLKDGGTQAQAKRYVVQAIESVAKELGNTKAVCRKCYIHPAVIDAYTEGSLLRVLRRRVDKALKNSRHQLNSEEAAVVALLQQQLRNGRRTGNGSSGKPPRRGVAATKAARFTSRQRRKTTREKARIED